jgi:uncharacterized protein (DUF4415 family)
MSEFGRRTQAQIKAERDLIALQIEVEELRREARAREGCPPGWAKIRPEELTRPRRVRVTLRVDQDVAKWFWQHGEGYQSLMNKVLRCYMLGKRAEVI